MDNGAKWKNWAGNQRSHPSTVRTPSDERELIAAVTYTAARGGVIKAVGAGHSFTAIARPEDVLLDLSQYSHISRIDPIKKQITAQSGCGLAKLNAELTRANLALPNLGDIDAQSIAGAVSTGTHGTGATWQSIAAGIVRLRLIAGDGSVIICDENENAELFNVARVGLGAIGLISEITFQCVDAFSLHAIEKPRHIDKVLAEFDAWVDSADHAEFFWFPHTDVAATKTNMRVALQADTRSRWQRVLDEEIMQNGLFGAITKVGTLRPSLIPKLAQGLGKGMGYSEYTAPSTAVFTSPRRIKFKEMEYNIPRGSLVEAFNRVRDLIDDSSEPIGFPIEVRVLGADDIPLSPAYERKSAYIAVHVPASVDHEEYFAGVENIMNDYGGRPHWGKIHNQSAKSLAKLYPKWDDAQAARDIIDPDRRFASTETRRILGD